jgi:hypothetical protein
VSPGKALVFIAVHEAVLGLYMGSALLLHEVGAVLRTHRSSPAAT